MKCAVKSENKVSLFEKIKSSTAAQCYLLLALPIIGFFVFTIYPMLWAAVKAFYYYDMVPSNTRFTGLENFKILFSTAKDYWNAWLVTFQFLLLKLPIEMPLALMFAFLLSKGLKGSNTIRNMYFLPCVISLAIVGIIFTNIFDVFGLANAWLTKFGLITEPIDWFSKKSSALFVLVFGGIWSSIGVNIIYFTAALSNVPEDLYEAAYIEGATSVQRFFYITLPMISKVFQVVLLLAINGTLRTGEFIIVMTNGAPAGRTLTAEAYITKAFLPGFASMSNPNLGYGSAMCIVSSVICAVVGIIYMKLTKKMTELY